jgi:hypothetical protein
MDTDAGLFVPSINATYILKYDLDDPQAGNVDGAGRRNFTNIGTSSPELRMNLGLNWSSGAHSANLFARYISSYDDDQNCSDGTVNTGSCDTFGGFKEVDNQVTYDIQYNVNLGTIFDTQNNYVLSVGGINITDEKPPRLFTNGGFDSKVHDPRGRQIYARFAVEF